MYKHILLLALGAAATAHAAPIYKCVDAQGATSFQSLPCPGKSTQTEVAVRKEPAPAAEPTQDKDRSIKADTREARMEAMYPMAPPPAAAPPPPATRQAAAKNMSYQCTVSNGMVFYQHQPCPAELSLTSTFFGSPVGGARSEPGFMSVTQKVVSRREACHEMRKPSASDRNGYDYDQKTATYEKLVGKDPCR